MLASPYPQERYWLARALATSPNPQATEDLIRMVADPHVNVRSMALQALAQRRDARAVQPILNLLKTSDEWYDQLYAYQALKALRWDQNRLP
jgi:HEAT repeat protein